MPRDTRRPGLPGAGVTSRSGDRAALVAAMLLAGINLRTAATSVGPLLDEVRADVGLSGFEAGLLTTLPVLAFALLGALAPRLARRYGDARTVFAGLLVMTVGLAVRSATGSAAPFLLASVAALAGGAVGNVLLPVLVKRRFPDRTGPLTAGYTTALAVGASAGAALSVPLAGLGDGVDWRVGLGVWAVPAALGALLWLRPALTDRPAGEGEGQARVPVQRSSTGIALAVFFGANALQAYVCFGWFALYFQERAGVSATEAGLLVAVVAAVGVPVSMVVPTLAARWPDQRPVLAVLLAGYVVAYAGMLLSPGTGTWAWAVLVGLAGGTFPLALTMIALRARTPGGTGSLSAFVQSTGYVAAGAGPLLVGVLHGATGGWGWPFALLFADLAVLAVAGWYAGRPAYVEDELAVR